MIQWGDDNLNLGKGLELLFILISIGVIFWYATNYPQLATQADLFWKLGVTGVVAILVGFAITRISVLQFNVILWDKSPIPQLQVLDKFSKFYLPFFILIGLITFFGIGMSAYSIEGGINLEEITKYQILDLGVAGAAILDFFSAVTEDIIFFGFFPALVFAVAYFVTRNPILSLLLAIILSPVIFLLYHTFRYGFSDVVNSLKVWFFGQEMMLWVTITGKMFAVHMRHAFNNASQAVFSQMSMQTFFIGLISSPIFWILTLLFIGSAFIVIRRRGVA